MKNRLIQHAGLMCALNPAFASVLGVIMLHEAVTVQGVCGAALILFSLFIPHFFADHTLTVNRQRH